MRAQQAGFDFDIFTAFDWTGVPTVGDETTAQHTARMRAERMDREFHTRQAETKARHEREQREREEQARRAHRARSSRYESPWDVLQVTPGCSGKEIRSALDSTLQTVSSGQRRIAGRYAAS